MRKRLTDAVLKNTKAPTSGRVEVHDTVTPGFAALIGPKSRSLYFFYRYQGKRRRASFGRYPATTLSQARAAAGEIQDQLDAGVDPLAGYFAPASFATLAQDFIDRYAKRRYRPRTLAETTRYISDHLLPSWGAKPLTAITRTDVLRLIDGFADADKGAAANRVLAVVRKIFNWAVERGYLDRSPVDGVRPPAKLVSRSRVLTTDELARVWLACEDLGYPFGPWVRMMIVTGGQRASDVAGMRWQDIDSGTWTIPEPTKSDESHAVPLSSLAMEILNQLPRLEGPFVLSTTAGRKPITLSSKAKKRLDALSHVTGWRIHDLRRTVATGFGEHLGLHPYVVEMVQNRKSGTIRGVMAVYNRARYENETRDALERWGAYLRSVAGGNVLSLPLAQDPLLGQEVNAQ